MYAELFYLQAESYQCIKNEGVRSALGGGGRSFECRVILFFDFLYL